MEKTIQQELDELRALLGGRQPVLAVLGPQGLGLRSRYEPHKGPLLKAQEAQGPSAPA